LAAARARGKLGGRPRVMDDRKLKMVQSLMKDPNLSIREICETLQVSKATLYRYLGKNKSTS
jgi:DNA invertase Pin-like site-specific DNA recombinase